MKTELSQERSDARTKFICEEGRAWKEVLADEFDKLDDGTAVVINIVNGEYVTAKTPLEALDKFTQQYGENNTFSYSFQVNFPIFVGGGIV